MSDNAPRWESIQERTLWWARGISDIERRRLAGIAVGIRLQSKAEVLGVQLANQDLR